VRIAGITQNASGGWVTQQARNLVIEVGGRERAIRFLIHDRKAKSSAAFDEVFRTERIGAIRTPFKAPNANAHAERFVRTLRQEWLDSLLIVDRRQLERVLREYVEHYNRERPLERSTCDRPNPRR
jgi:transposase InsO family protein